MKSNARKSKCKKRGRARAAISTETAAEDMLVLRWEPPRKYDTVRTFISQLIGPDRFQLAPFIGPDRLQEVDKSVLLQEFQKDAEANVETEIDARLVCLTLSGEHEELMARLSSTRLYQNLSQDVRFMGFYDVKNALLLDRRIDESIIQREPLLDMDKFRTFCVTANAVMQPNRDLVWILTGRTDKAFEKIHKEISSKIKRLRSI